MRDLECNWFFYDYTELPRKAQRSCKSVSRKSKHIYRTVAGR